MSRVVFVLLVVLAVLCSACDSGAGLIDAGPPDAGAPADAGTSG